MNHLELEKLANEIRKSIVTAVHSAKSGHPGGSHCGGMETSRLRDPPQAEESRKRDSIYTGKMRSILSRIRPDSWSSIKHPLCGIMDSKIQQKEYLVLPAGDDCSDV